MALDNEFFVGNTGGLASPTILSQARGTTAGGEYMAKLGDYMFSLDTAAFQSLQRDTGYRWQSIKRIGRTPAQQFTGIDDDTIELSGVIYPHFRGGLAQIGLMRAQAGAGKPLPLVYAFERSGQYCGLWCIRGIREGRTEFFRNGAPRRIEFTLSLVAYGEDAGLSAQGLLSLPSVSLASGQAGQPALLSTSLSDAVAASLRSIESLPLIMLTSPVEDVRAAAAAVTAAGAAAAGIVTTSQAGIVAALGSGNPTGLAAVPGEAKLAAQEIIKTATAGLSSIADIASSIAVVRDNPEQVRETARLLRTAMQGVRAATSIPGGVVKSAAAKLSVMTGFDIERLAGAATLGNIDRAADAMLYAFNQADAQATAVMGKINV